MLFSSSGSDSQEPVISYTTFPIASSATMNIGGGSV
jgi:hypothetical protein